MRSDRQRSTPTGFFSDNPKSKIANPKLFPPLLQHFSDKFTDRRLVHPVGAVDKRVAILVFAFGPLISARHFVLGNVDAQGIRTFISAAENYSLSQLALAREQPV